MARINAVFLDLSAIEKQLYGVRCLEAFVQTYEIQHPSVDRLLDHLRSIGGYSFGRWERAGALLPLNGRGDPAPSDLIEELPEDLRPDFLRLVDSVVEIGMVDAYAVDSISPLRFLLQAVAILEVHEVPLPALDFGSRRRK
ncbi:hypothetical protein ABID97_003936 [Variovorax sp. OAS795]|uniref:hypothetical protein n=1 Tax=Variovorax sp. OAS795 TaxID=3034231 RepID=UPI003396E0F3